MVYIPYSDEKLVDESKPGDCNVIQDWDDYIRETRAAVNFLSSLIPSACKAVQVVGDGASVDATGASLILLSTQEGVGAAVYNLTGGAPGQTVVLRAVRPELPEAQFTPITIAHDLGNIYLDDHRNFKLWPDDFVVLRFCDASESQEICLQVLEGTWTEMSRTLARNAPDERQPHWIGVDEYGAVTVETIR